MLLLALAGCTPTPEPAPTPTSPFASEAEAFAAAEETYRAYVDAVNARREDPSAQPDPTEFLIGEALEAEISTEQLKDQQRLSITGRSEVANVGAVRSTSSSSEVVIEVCLDASETRVIDESGEDVTPSDRDTRSRLSVTLQLIHEEYLISSSTVATEPLC